jgi:DNA-binding LytR/AlgR family response regulator
MTTAIKKYNCLIVDDEPIARKILENYVSQMPNLTCVGVCKNAFEALEKINSDSQIDLVFLDINMPNLSGTALAKMLPKKPLVIFTTAYADFAVESYELNAVDYLLKPFLFERFAQAVFRAIERMRDFTAISPVFEPKNEQKTIFIKSEGENYPVVLAEIMFCEAMKNYTKVVLANGKTLHPLVSISKFEEDLTVLSPDFLRIHRSFLVSKKYLASIGANYVLIGDHKIPIGEQYKAYFLAEMGVKN